jgi:O-antigen ligase
VFGVFALAKAPADGSVVLARTLLLGLLVAMLVSTSLAIGFEIASYLAFACIPELRRRLGHILLHPLMIGFLPFAAVITVAAFYGDASWHDSLSSLIGWRRLLLLPLALAVFDEGSKRLLLKVLIIACLAGALASFFGVWEQAPGWFGRGVVFHNYATQGLAMSLAIIGCTAAVIRPAVFAGDWLMGNRRLMAVALAVMGVDVVFILEGRSGYLAVMIMLVTLAALLAKGSWRMKALAGVAVAICLGVALVSSEQVRERVAQGINEIVTVDQVSQGTSIGQRVVMWRNSVRMIRDHLIFGVGTGAYQDGYRPYVQGETGWQSFETSDPHDQFLKILGEQGIMGLAAFLFFLFRALACPAPPPYRQLAVAAVIGWCATSLANSHFSTFVEGRLLYLWLGAMLAGGLEHPPQRSVTNSANAIAL